MKTTKTILKNKMQAVFLMLALFLTFSFATVKAQNDTMYIMKAGVVVGKHNVDTQVDSVIFYNPQTQAEFTCGGILTDERDGNAYPTVAIGSQCWLAKNLAYLPAVHNNATFETQGINSQPAYGVYAYDGSDTATAKAETNYSTYGVLYNWWAAMAGGSSCNGTGESQPACSTPVQGICPDGWHLPSHYEYTALERAVCSSDSCATDFPYDITTIGYRGTNEGSKLAKDTTLWTVGNLFSNDSIGTSTFSVLPGGSRDTNGTFNNESNLAYLWSSTESGTNAWGRGWNYYYSAVYRNYGKKHGFSVRCVRNN